MGLNTENNKGETLKTSSYFSIKFRCLKSASPKPSNGITISWCSIANSPNESVRHLYKVCCVSVVICVIAGGILAGASYVHPCRSERVQPFLPAAHVTAGKGTGLVHSAPAHGPEDFLVALKHSISIVSISTGQR